MKKKILRFLDGFLTVFLLVMLLINFYNILQRNVMKNDMPKILGYGYAVVISGSMEPEISVNDIVYVKEQDSYAVGDIITYKKYDSYITHRIIDIVDGEYVTKGDSNNTPDTDTVMMEQIEGKVTLVLPVFGAMVLYMKTPIGTLVALLVALICLEVPYRVRLSRARKKGRNKYKRMAKNMERIQNEIKKLDEEAAAAAAAGVTDAPEQILVQDPEMQYQTFLEQMLQAKSVDDITLPSGLAPAKPLDGEVVIGGSTEPDDDYLHRVASKAAAEKVAEERAALLEQGYAFAPIDDSSLNEAVDAGVAEDMGTVIDMVESDAVAVDAVDTPEIVEPATPGELPPGSAMAAMLAIASSMNTNFNLTYEDYDKGNEELLRLEAELAGVTYEEPVAETLSEEPVEYTVAEEAPVEYAVPEGTYEEPYQPSAEAEEYARMQVEEAYAAITAEPEIESEEVVYEEPVGGVPAEYAESEVSQEGYAVTTQVLEYGEEQIGDFTEETPVEYEAAVYEPESYEQDAVPTGYIDEEELARLRRIAEIEAELYGTEYVDPLETMPGVQVVPVGETPIEYAEAEVSQEEYVPEAPVEYSPEEIVTYAEAAEEYAETVVSEEPSNEQFAVTDFVPEEPQGYAAAGGYVIDEEELARLRRIAEIEAELYGTEYVDPLESMQDVQVVTDAEVTVDTTVSDEYAAIMQEEYVPDTLVGYEAAEYVEEPAIEPVPDIVEQVAEEQIVEESETVKETPVEQLVEEIETVEQVVEETEMVEEAPVEQVVEEQIIEESAIVEETVVEEPVIVETSTAEEPVLSEEELARQRRIAEIEAELAGVPYVPDEEFEIDSDLDPEELARQKRIAEIEAELDGIQQLSPKKRAMMEAREERRHKRAVDKHRRKGPPVYIPEEGVWNISVDEYSLEDVLGKDEK